MLQKTRKLKVALIGRSQQALESLAEVLARAPDIACSTHLIARRPARSAVRSRATSRRAGAALRRRQPRRAGGAGELEPGRPAAADRGGSSGQRRSGAARCPQWRARLPAGAGERRRTDRRARGRARRSYARLARIAQRPGHGRARCRRRRGYLAGGLQPRGRTRHGHPDADLAAGPRRQRRAARGTAGPHAGAWPAGCAGRGRVSRRACAAGLRQQAPQRLARDGRRGHGPGAAGSARSGALCHPAGVPQGELSLHRRRRRAPPRSADPGGDRCRADGGTGAAAVRGAAEAGRRADRLARQCVRDPEGPHPGPRQPLPASAPASHWTTSVAHLAATSSRCCRATTSRCWPASTAACR